MKTTIKQNFESNITIIPFAEFKALSDEPWLVVRKKIYIIEEFLKKWHMNFENLESNPLVSRITQEILKYEVGNKYCFTNRI